MSINLFGRSFGFGFLPLLAILVWPRDALEIPSVAIIFCIGLFTDWATGGITGQWSLIFCVGYGVLRPDLRAQPYAPFRFLIAWLVLAGLAIALAAIIGWFVFGVRPDIGALGRQMLMATAILPIVYGVRRLILRLTRDPDEWGR